MAAGDLARLTTLVTTARVEELGEPNALETLKLATVRYPEGASITGVRVTGDDATLQLTGKTQAGSAEGTVQLRRELGAWKGEHRGLAYRDADGLREHTVGGTPAPARGRAPW